MNHIENIRQFQCRLPLTDITRVGLATEFTKEIITSMQTTSNLTHTILNANLHNYTVVARIAGKCCNSVEIIKILMLNYTTYVGHRNSKQAQKKNNLL